MRLSRLVVAALLLSSPAFGAVIGYSVFLSGPNESPTNASPGIGTGSVVVDTIANTLSLNLTFSLLTGTVTASHIHSATAVAFAGTAGVATTTPTFAGFPSGVTSGSYFNTLDLTLLSSYNPAFVTANGGTTASAEAALVSSFAAGKAYWNIHTSTFGGGEIRGFLVASAPEPATFAMAAAALLGLAAMRRRR